jgi:ArsR family transcriptional regulator
MIRNNKQNLIGKPAAMSQEEAMLWEMQADMCQTLANPKRLQILNLLKDGELSVGAMVQALGVAKANLSQHLGVMRQKGILLSRREGTTIYYRLGTPHIAEACKIMRLVLLEALTARGELSRSLLLTEKMDTEGE